MDIRIIGDTIEIDYRAAAMILPQASATQREDMAQAVEYAAAYEKLEEKHNAVYDKAREEGYDNGYRDAEREYAALLKAARVLCTSPSPIGLEDLKQALAALDV